MKSRREKLWSLFSRLFCLFGVLCGSIHNFGIAFSISMRMTLIFWLLLQWIFTKVQVVWNINSTKSPVYEHGMSCQFLVPCSTFSVWCVVFSELVVSFWRPCVPPSLISESVVEGWVREEMQCLFLPSHLFSDDVQHRFPWALCPYLSPQEEYLLRIPLRSGCWHCCFSVPKAHEYLGCVHEPRKYLEKNHQIKPVKCSAETVGVQFTGLQVLCLPRLETKERSQSCQR